MNLPKQASLMNMSLNSQHMESIEAQSAQGQLSSLEELHSSIEQAEAELSRGEGIPLETAIEQLQEKFRKAREVVKNCET